MANKDYTLPFQDLTNLVPNELRNPMAKSLLDNLFNRFLTQDEAVPLYGYVGRKPTSPDDRTPKVPQLNVERDINALIPVFSFKSGSETHSFTAQDLIRKAQVLGISEDQSQWLYSQGNNYAPPIDLDKFTNFFNYYWVAKALPSVPELPWNPSKSPEYYTIAVPKPADLDKLNARTSSTGYTTLTGTGYLAQTWTVTFTSPTEFTVTTSDSTAPVGEQTQGPFTLPALTAAPFPGPWPTDTFPVQFTRAGAPTPLLTFNITRDIVLDGTGQALGYETFAAGDTFTITAPFLTSTYSVSFTGGSGTKGKITAVNSLNTYQTVNGVQLAENDRVLVRHGPVQDQGIYVVKPGQWVRAADFTGETASAGAKIFVTNGGDANSVFTSYSSGSWFSWNLLESNVISNTNHWQEGNFWVKRDDLVAVGADMSRVIQATRPIIEFMANLQLSSFVGSDGKPTDANDVSGTFFEQRKTEFNQAPFYDLYHYDGTHARRVSSLFYYVEDPTADVDPALQRRVKHADNDSGDFLFAHGMVQEDNGLLFYADTSGTLHTVWHAGYSEATIVDQEYGGNGNGTLSVQVGTDPYSPQQIWTLTATGEFTFEVTGSKMKVLPAPHDVITVGVPYSNGLFTAMITAGTVPFEIGDNFKFRVGNFETTRYVYRDADDNSFDLFGGQAADVVGKGAWQVPRMFYNNVAADNGDEVPEGTLYSHFRGILLNQLQTTSEDRAFGGSIKLWSEQQNLLASLLMQRDMTPISMIDLAQQQYETAVNSLVDIYTTKIVEYFSKHEVPSSAADINDLLDYVLSVRAKDDDVRTVLFDSSSPLIGFPATLPQLGVTPLMQPGYVFDNELGATVIRHHDGHLSPLFVQDSSFRDRIFSPTLKVKRSDGTTTAAIGSYSTAAPTQPYKGLIWLYGGTELHVFDVVADTTAAPAVTGLEVGDYWYNRGANLLSKWDGAFWQPEPSLDGAWLKLDLAELLNDMLVRAEERLYSGISTKHRTYFSAEEVQDAMDGVLKPHIQRELNTWAVANGYDPTAPNYDSADAFTWNYSSAISFAPVSTGTVPARWFDALQAHHKTFGSQVIPTSRPNLEPWKLLGHATKPGIWDSVYRATLTPDDVAAGVFVTSSAHAVLYSETPLSTPLTGLPVVDGNLLSAGQVVLLVSEAASANNGPWVISSGAWARAGTPLAANTLFNIEGGQRFTGAQFVLLDDVLNVNTDPVNITQVRLWVPDLWAEIQTARPGLKLSVDVNRDALLPPYVSAYLPTASYALTNVMPSGIADPYNFGESSPVETVWKKSIEYRYSLARALFRYDPLSFLGNCWGFEWVDVDGVLYDGYDMAVPGHPRFRLHGQDQQNISRSTPIYVASATGPEAFTMRITRDAYTALRAQSWSVKVDDVLVGHVSEGVMSTVSGNGYTVANILIEDQGRPFRIGDSFMLTADAAGTGMTIVFEPKPYHVIHGFGQTFTHALRAASIDTDRGYAISAYRDWNVNIGYRAGGLVSTDDLRVFTDQESLPDSAFELRFKRSPYAGDMWAQALRVTAVQMGAGTDAGNGSIVPAGNAADWVFRIEGYNSRYLTFEYFTYDNGGDHTTFYALNKVHTDLQWKHHTTKTGIVKAELPLTVRGLQNVIAVLYGYSQKLEADGWRFNDDGLQNIDQSTGRVRNWQLEIEKLIDSVYTGVQLDQGHVLNPFIDRIWLAQDTGLMSEFFDTALFDVTAHPAVFDLLGVKISTNNLNILRRRETSEIGATVPMFSVHAQLDEYEHLFVFNNLSSPSTNSGLIYDPFSGARISTIKLNGRRQASRTLRPEFGGHYLVGDEVKKNFQASTDKISRYYDTNHVYEDEQSTKHALALLGFTPKQYMADLDLNDRSQFNFWRGLVQMKGTNASITAFLNNDRFEDAKLDEYWAYKVAEYGDSRSKIFPEMKLTVNDTLQQFTKLIFDSTAVPADFSTFTTITADDEARWFSIDDLNGETSFEAQVIGTHTNAVQTGDIIMLPFIADALAFDDTVFEQINASSLVAIADAGVSTIIGYGPSTPKFNPVKLFNYANPELVEEIPHWHPAIGQHAPSAMESVNVVSSKDPARYNVSTLVLGNSNYDPLRVWGTKEVGRVWWDTTNLDYLPYSDSKIFKTVDERLSRWGTLADYATVDVVEWVQSSVSPAQYDAQAKLDAGNADLEPSTRAEGTVYGAKTYSRERVWSVYPIAWSKAGVALETAHPAFSASYDSDLSFEIIDGAVHAVLESKTFAAAGITAGMRIGAWQENLPVDTSKTRPLSEYLVLDDFTKFITGGTASATVDTLSASATITTRTHTAAVGKLDFVYGPPELIATQLYDADGLPTEEWDIRTYVRVLLNDTSDIFAVRVDRGTGPDAAAAIASATFSTHVGQKFFFEIPQYGLLVTVTATSAGTYNTVTMAEFLQAAFSDVEIFDAVGVQEIVPLDPAQIFEETGLAIGTPTIFSNNEFDTGVGRPYTENSGVGWRAWSVPTQAELNADSRVPNSSWFPYVGVPYTYSTVPVSVVQDGAANPTYTLNNGAVIHRYKTEWAEWAELKQLTLRAVQTRQPVLGVPQALEFTVPEGTTSDRVSVYLNGVAQLAGTYTVVGKAVTLLAVPFGFHAVVIVRAYAPSAAELAFNPDQADDLLIQRQYKTDYQYVELPVRDNDGTIVGTKYFFWVKNRTTPAKRNELSVKSIAQILTEGPSQFLTFQNINDDLGSWSYNALAINGLNYIVTKNDTFKLRFTRNFTLRDDPQQLDLKDTHTEWSLIRPGQRTKIPEVLWCKLVNTACGVDEAGNTLPSPRRASYDERNGTRTRFGFGPDQVLAPTELVTSTLLFTILNTQLLDESGVVPIPDYMTFLDFGQSETWFSTAANTRNTLTQIWNRAKVSQINELFFAVLEDMAAANYALTDVFKTSRLSAYSIKVVRPGPVAPSYE